MTTPADFRGGDAGIVFRCDAERLLHRDDFGSFEGTVHFIRLVEAKISSKCIAKGLCGVDLHVVADRARHPIAGQGRVVRITLLFLSDSFVGDGLQHITREQLPVCRRCRSEIEEPGVATMLAFLAKLIHAELLLAHDAVAMQAEILDDLFLWCMHRALGFELREKDRVATCQAHRRGAPFSIRCQVDQQATRLGLHRHVGAQAGRPGGVAPHTLVGCEELGWSVGPGYDVIISLRLHVQGGIGKDVDHRWQRGGAKSLQESGIRVVRSGLPHPRGAVRPHGHSQVVEPCVCAAWWRGGWGAPQSS